MPTSRDSRRVARLLSRAVRQDVIAIDGLLRLLDPEQPVATRKAAAEMLIEAGRSERHVPEAVVSILEQDSDPTLKDWSVQGRQVLADRP